jgi:hypothetical protein
MWAVVAGWASALFARANLADACVLALLLVFFWVDVAKVSEWMSLVDY